jgi:SDR family mycofactocin-dependent oxidoreductase
MAARSDGRFAGKVVLVTGVARGQGRSHAVRFAEEGADVIGVDICADIASTAATQGSLEDLEETRKLVEAAGGQHHLVQADVRRYDELSAAIDEGVRRFGRLDVVAANAGINSVMPAITIPEQTWQDMLDVVLTGVWHTVKAAVPHLQAGGRGGAMVFTSSVCGYEGLPGLAHYNAAKHGVEGLAKTLAAELGPDGIRVNTVNPTNVNTPMIQNEFVWRMFMPDLEHPTQEDAEKPGSPFRALHVLDIPWVEPVDISEAVLFLASDAARYITGVQLPIDAGFMVKK